MENNSLVTMIDAISNVRVPLSITQDESKFNLSPLGLDDMLEKFTIDDYKAIFLLCLDYISVDEILILKKEKTILKERFYQLYCDKIKNEQFLVELLGTLKLYEYLKLMNTCCHIYKNKENDFNRIKSVWKILFAVCEEITDDDLENLKHYMPENIQAQILSAEDWFMVALKLKKFTQTDLSYLKSVFSDNPVCLNIINTFKVPPKEYSIKTPTIHHPCGQAVIFNFETFDKASELQPRAGSNMDVEALKKLWTAYGFQTKVVKDLKLSDFSREIERYALMDHKNYDAFVCCILSHGETNAIFTSDGCSISISDIINTFCRKCKSLNGKPKIFIIQACQGTKVRQGAGETDYSLENSVKPPCTLEQTMCPSHEDVLTITSTVSGYVSFRCPVKGSWFIQTLCRVMLDADSDNVSVIEKIPDITNEVCKLRAESELLKDAIQIVPTFLTLRKKLILKKLKAS